MRGALAIKVKDDDMMIPRFNGIAYQYIIQEYAFNSTHGHCSRVK